MENHNKLSQATPSLTVCRGVRGATTVMENTREAILEATREMLLNIDFWRR